MPSWTGPAGWKIVKGLIDFSQIASKDMGDNDLLKISGVGGGSGDTLSREPVGMAVSSIWGTECYNLPIPDDDIVTFSHHTGIPCYLQHVPGAAGIKAKIKCYIGEYTPKSGRPPTGAAWTAEDQT
jgi:hypothetical protein